MLTASTTALVPDTKSKKERVDELLEEFTEILRSIFIIYLMILVYLEKIINFYENCTMAMRILGGKEIMENCYDSSSVLQCLLGIKKEHQPFFSPNLGDGVKWKKESHGLVMVHIGGTLYQGAGLLVGMFEQQFILRDPHLEKTHGRLLT